MAEATRHHEHGFNHAIRQAKRFCDLKGHEFNIGMDFYQGKYMPYDDMPDEVSSDEDVEPLHAEGGEEEAETQVDDTQAQEDEAENKQFVDVVGDDKTGPSGKDNERPSLGSWVPARTNHRCKLVSEIVERTRSNKGFILTSLRALVDIVDGGLDIVKMLSYMYFSIFRAISKVEDAVDVQMTTLIRLQSHFLSMVIRVNTRKCVPTSGSGSVGLHEHECSMMEERQKLASKHYGRTKDRNMLLSSNPARSNHMVKPVNQKEPLLLRWRML
ncbi:hypothetical protein Fmac_030987 [Flemingia macrophylla]|uniref:Uncharacterized protein n=1 Tax=Flemingia macrophylla TaxID=520843 RepID=A0ABD1L0U6_9FABA